jgi:hypothetical protein
MRSEVKMFRNERSLVLAATPMENAELRTIFSDQPDSIRRKMENPPTLRGPGWDLPSSTQAEFVKGELIRTVESGRIIADLYRDGTLVVGAKVDQDFLAWSDKNDLRLHPLALIEVTVNFTRFYRDVLADFRATPAQVKFRVELNNMHLEGQKVLLRSGSVQRFPTLEGGARKEAPTDTWSKEFVVSSESYDPDEIAFRMIRELYLWFGHAEEAMPYTKDTAGTRTIDADQIAHVR